MPRHFFLLPLLIGVTLSACAVSSTHAEKSGKETKRSVAVVVSRAKRQSLPIVVQTTGVAQAYATVAVKSQIAGLLTQVYFKEGQDVQKGDRLFTIDPRILKANLSRLIAERDKAAAQVAQAQAQIGQAQAQVTQAQAGVARDQAQAQNSVRQADRYTSLLNEGVVSQEQADQFRSTAQSQKATVEASRSNVGNAIAAVASARANLKTAQAALNSANAAVESAKVELTYTAIFSPITGRLGKLNIDQGNLVKDNDTNPLVVISQVEPIYVEFSLPQRLLPELKKYQERKTLTVTAIPPQAMGNPVQGDLVFIDSNIDNTTGTIKLKASFTNHDRQLTPGQFVKVKIKLTEQQDAIVVPTTAVQSGQKGTFVYVIAANKTAEPRPVTTGVTVNNLIAINNGLQAGEQVVTDGQFNLTPGAQVRMKQKQK